MTDGQIIGFIIASSVFFAILRCDLRTIREDLKDISELIVRQQPAEAEVADSGGGITHWYKCGKCQTEINLGDKFCNNCGRKILWNKVV